jgi:tetratricopeptide (TPR) repeat protein
VPTDPQRARVLLFWCAIVATPIGFLGACELLARVVVSQPADPRLALRGDPVFFEHFERDGAPWVRIAHDELYGSGTVELSEHKPEGVLRIFALGGSASAGWPHPRSESYAVVLQHALQKALPGRRVEVIDASAHAWASYRVRLVLRRVLAFEPDLVVVYSGNNEFLERRTYLGELPAVLRGLALVRGLRRLLLPWVAPGAALAADHREHASHEVWTKLRRQALELRSDPDQFERLSRHYAESIEGMAREAAAAGVPLVLVTVPVNLRDWRPNVSTAPPPGPRGREWERHVDGGRRRLMAGDAESAVRELRVAADLAPEHAETRFWLGRAFEAAGHDAEARAAYRAAVDLDRNPFRALSRFNTTVRDVAAREPGVHLADAEAAFEAAVAPRAPGFDLFLDYVHPTARGNQLVARSVFGAVLASGTVDVPRRDVAFEPPAPSHYHAEEDPTVQRTLLLLFAMMHQHDALVDRARAHAGRAEPEWRFARRYLRVFGPLVALEERRLAGGPIPAAERARVEARLEAFYARQYPKALVRERGAPRP